MTPLPALRRRLAAALAPDPPAPRPAPEPDPDPLALAPCPGEGCTAPVTLGALLARRDVRELLGEARWRYMVTQYGQARRWHQERAAS